MKTYMRISALAAASVMIIFASSCSTQRQNDFASRKYYNFPRNEGNHQKTKSAALVSNNKIQNADARAKTRAGATNKKEITQRKQVP